MTNLTDRRRRLEHAIAEYLSAADSGQPSEPQEWIDRYPELRPELSQFISDQASFDELVRPLRRAASAGAEPFRDPVTGLATTSESECRRTSEHCVHVDREIGDYAIVREIGRGGMGVVFEARQISLDRRVALKVLRPGLLTSDEALQWLRGEAQSAAALDHAAIVPVYHVGMHAGVSYFTMKLVEGGTLVSEWRRFHDTPHQAATVLLALAEAVGHAHQRGVLHCDLKPGNVLIDEQGKPHINDFGLARRLHRYGEAAHPVACAGTPSYMAPEQTEGDESDLTTVTDIYGLGAILYSVLTGQAPFRGDSVLSTIEQVRHSAPGSPSRLNPAVPPDLEAMCLKCLAKDPADRYSSTGALADDLRRFLAGDPVEARPLSRPERLRRQIRRNPLVSALCGSVVVLLFTAVIVSTWAAARFERIAGQRQRALEERSRALAEVTASKRLANERLYGSLLDQARAGRRSGQIGRRLASLEALRQATGLARELQVDDDQVRALRNEAIACTSLLDLQVERQWPGHPPISEQVRVAFDADLERYARLEPGDTREPAAADGHVYGDIVVRRMSDNSELNRLPGSGYMSRRPYLRFSSDGQMLATFGISPLDGVSRRVAVWKLSTGEKVLDQPSRCVWFATAVDFSPDNRFVVMLDEQAEACVYDVADGSLRKPFPGRTFPDARCVRFAPDGHRLAVSNGNTLEILDLSTGAAQQPHEFPAGVKDAAWGPDGSLLAVASGNRVWVIELRKRLKRQLAGSHNSRTLHVFFNHRGDVLASTGWDFTTRFWDPRTGRQRFQCGQFGLAFSRDDQRLGWGTAGASVGRWRVFAPGGPAMMDTPLDEFHRWSVIPNGRLLIAAAPDGMVVWDLATRTEVGFLEVPETSFVAFNDAGDTMWTSMPGALVRWPVEIIKEHARFDTPESLPLMPDWRAAAVSNDGRWLAAIEVDETKDRTGVMLQGVGSANDGVLLEHTGCRRAAFSPDGRWLATAGRRGQAVRVWETRTARLAVELAMPTSAEVRFSPDGRWLATGGQHESVLWEAGTWQPRLRIPRTLAGEVGAVAFDPPSRLLAVLDQLHTIQLVDLKTRKHVATLEAMDAEPIYTLSFAADGEVLLAASHDGRVQVWNLARIRRQLAAIGLDWL